MAYTYFTNYRFLAKELRDSPDTNWNVINLELGLPIVDGHCHIFGQALFEPGDILEVGAYWDLVIFKGTNQRNIDNARIVLGAVPKIVWQNHYLSGSNASQHDYARACVALLLDLGYTPMVFPAPIDLSESLRRTTEQAETDAPQSSPAPAGSLVLRIETLYCKASQENSGDDEIQIRIHQGGQPPRILPSDTQGYNVPDADSTRMISEEIVLDPNAGDVFVQLLELDFEPVMSSVYLDGHDNLGTESLPAIEKAESPLHFGGWGADYDLHCAIETKTPDEHSAPPPAFALPQYTDTYYDETHQYHWFKRPRNIFEGTIRVLSRAAATFPGEVWPFPPFDPRRPHALDCLRKAVDDLGCVGVKLYPRCGWIPAVPEDEKHGNREIHGDASAKGDEMNRGGRLDYHLSLLFDYVTDHDLPVIVHASPGGFPPRGQLALPKYYYPNDDRPPTNFDGPCEGQNTLDVPFPPIWARASASETSRRRKISDACTKLASYCHYIQKTSSPYSWERVLNHYPSLRLCFAHSGSAVSMHFEYASKLESKKQSDNYFKGKYATSTLYKEIRKDSFCACAGADFRKCFIEAVAGKVHVSGQSMQQIRSETESFLERDFGGGKVWKDWFEKWKQAYPLNWFAKMAQLMETHANVYCDISYLQGENECIFDFLLRTIVDDARGSRGVLKKRLIIGTDWFMLMGDDLTAEGFWNRARKAMEVTDTDFPPAEKRDLWIRWSSLNVLDWLNLKPQIGKLEQFYAKHGKTPPQWWPRLKKYYDSKWSFK